MKIAVDAMGGDYAPAVVMEAIQSVLKEIPDVEILLVGHKEKLSYYMEKMNLVPSDRLELVHAETVVEMSDPSTAAIRAKKNSSITVCATLVAEGKADAVASAGHTGAAVAASKIKMRMVDGVDRPCIGSIMPNLTDKWILADAGANISTINSIVPTNCTAGGTISAETIDLTMTLEELMNRLSAIQGVLKADVLAG